jgi:hypothetical protein
VCVAKHSGWVGVHAPMGVRFGVGGWVGGASGGGPSGGVAARHISKPTCGQAVIESRVATPPDQTSLFQHMLHLPCALCPA